MPDVDVPCQNFDKCHSMEKRSSAVLKGMLKTGKKVICCKCSEERHVILSQAKRDSLRCDKPKVKTGRPPKKRTTFTINGMTRTLLEWSEATGIKYNTLYARLNTIKWPKSKILK